MGRNLLKCCSAMSATQRHCSAMHAVSVELLQFGKKPKPNKLPQMNKFL